MKIGKYELIEPLGQGGFATVYRARDPALARTVAVKICQATDAESLERFVREARLSGNLQHPNIAQVFDFGVENGVPFLVQEFLGGSDLAEVLHGGLPDLPFVLSVLVQVARGLNYAHTHQVMHRDIKPSNIRVLPDGLVKILDFGIARLMQDDSRLTRTGEALGTVGYFAPEILLGKEVDLRADLFSFGVVAYELCTGKHPFLTGDLGHTLYAIVHHNPLPPAGVRPDCPPELSDLVVRCLAKDTNQRWQSAAELLDVLEALARRFQVDVGAVAPAPRPGRPLVPGTVRKIVGKTQALWQAQRAPLVLLTLGLGLVGLALAWLPRAGKHELGLVELPVPAPTPRPTATPLATPVPVATPVAEVAVELVVVPPAFVKLGDRELGKIARESLRLRPGSYRVTYWIPGYRTEVRTIRIEAQPDGQEVVLSMPAFALLSVVPEFGTPVAGARVFLNDRLLGALPLLNAKVDEGSYGLRVTWPDGATFEVTCQVKAEEPTTVTVRKPL